MTLRGRYTVCLESYRGVDGNIIYFLTPDMGGEERRGEER